MQLAKFSDSSASTFIIEKVEKLNKEILDLKLEVDSLNSESTQIKSSNINLDTLIKNLDNFNNEIDNANFEQKKLLLNSILESIEWSSKDNNLIINYIGFNSNTNSLNHTSKINSKLHFSRDTRSYINE